MINYSNTDIDLRLAYDAHRGTSHVPQDRANQEVAGYVAEMKALAEEFGRWVTPENEAALKADLERYRQGYIGKLSAVLRARSRCMSSMIAGPSNFPVRRNQKANETADRRSQEFIEWRKKALERLRRTHDPAKIASAPISSDDEDVIEQLELKVAEAEKTQAMMVAANKIIRKKSLTDEQKVAGLIEIEGITKPTARQLLQPDFMGKQGYPTYALQNNSANIRRTKERIEQLTRERDREEAPDIEINGVTISENREINRLQLRFPGKPPQAVIDRLSASGFHWSRRENAWQRLLNGNAREAARRLVESLG